MQKFFCHKCGGPHSGLLHDTIHPLPKEARERREKPRMSDIHRAVDKIIDDGEKEAKEAIAQMFPATNYPTTSYYVKTQSSAFDKNSPAALKVLRWSIYELIERYEGDYGKTISGCLRQEVERLFQEHTNS